MSNVPDFVKWEARYDIGNELIDSQHRIFVMLLNKLAITVRSGATEEYMFRVLNELKKYAEFHFLSEENLMIEFGYPDLKKHEEIHSKILLELNVLADHMVHDNARPLDVVIFLRSWLFNHILNEDSHIAQHIKTHQKPV